MKKIELDLVVELKQVNSNRLTCSEQATTISNN